MDSVVRAITDDGAFRVIAARTTETVRGAVAAQGATGETAKHFGELVTGTILVREAMAPRFRVQGILKGAHGRGSLIADSHPDGSTRGLVHFGDPGDEPGRAVALGKGALLQMMRTLANGAIHQGVVAVPEAGGISEALMAYMQESEQVVSMIAVATLLDGDAIQAAGGYLVQLLPEVERGPLMIMTERLQDLASPDPAAGPSARLLERVLGTAGAPPDAFLDELLHGMPFSRLEESPLRFGCQCSELRLLASLATLPRSDIEDLARADHALEIRCDYCGHEYAFDPGQLRTLLTPA
jgi:molecular chaperone Hsp33